MILEAYFKLWRGWSKTQGQKVISDTSLPQKLKDKNLHKSGKCRPMWPKICPKDQIGLATGTLHWREHNIWLNEWQKKSFLLSLQKSHAKMFQEAARLQGGNPPSMMAVTIRKRNYLWTWLDKKQRFYRDMLGSGLKGVHVGSWTRVNIKM